MRRGVITALFVLSFAVCWSGRVSAQADEVVARVAEHDARATELFEAGDFAAALAEQRAAQALLPATPRLFNMAVCQERLGNLRAAIDLYREFMAAEDSPPERRQLARQRIIELEAELNGPAPGESTGAAGEGRATGAGGAEAGGAETGGAGAGGAETGTEGGGASAAVLERDRSGRVLSPVGFYTMLGLTGASAIAMVVCGAITLNMHQEFLDQPRGGGDSYQLQDDGRNLAMVTNILIGVTSVFAASTLVLGLLTRWNNSAGEAENERGVALVPGLGALSLEGRF